MAESKGLEDLKNEAKTLKDKIKALKEAKLKDAPDCRFLCCCAFVANPCLFTFPSIIPCCCSCRCCFAWGLECPGSEIGKEGMAPLGFEVRRTLAGHQGKIYSIHWSGEPTKLVSGGIDKHLIVWNAVTGNKLALLGLKKPWALSVAFEQTENTLVAAGDLDNVVTIFNVSNLEAPVEVKRLHVHDGYLPGCRFLDRNRILTASGDATAAISDIEAAKSIQVFDDHGGDVQRFVVSAFNACRLVVLSRLCLLQRVH